MNTYKTAIALGRLALKLGRTNRVTFHEDKDG